MTKEFKLLGNCPICGNLQAVNGGMSKHGYTVSHGWFAGICYGERKAPIQHDKAATLTMVADVLAQIAKLEADVEKLKTGEMKPKTAPIASHYKADEVPFDQAPEYMQKQRVEQIIRGLEFKVKSGRNHVEHMLALVLKVHGTELIKQAKPIPPAQIMTGESRQGKTRVMTCTSVEGSRIYYKDEKGFKSYTSPQAWRKFPKL
jgi:hypothetical protein